MQGLLESGTAGLTIWFVIALMGLAIFGLLWLLYVSHCFLTVLAESSIGDAEVRWPDETILDWWWEPIFCLVLLSFWLIMAGLLMGVFMLVSPWAYAAAVGLFLWYIYPIGMLCVMEARSPVAVVHLPLFLRLFAHVPAVLLVGLATLLPAALVFGSLAGLLLWSVFWAIPAALLLPPALFFYARCWGRLAWLVLNYKPRAQKAPREVAPPEAARAKINDPWAAPPAAEIPELDVTVDEPPPPAPEAEETGEWVEQPAPYVVSAARHAGDKPADGFTHGAYFDASRKRQEAREARAEGRKPGERKRRRRATFRNAFGAELLPFFVQHRTIRSLLSLAAITLVLLFLLRVAILTVPAAG